MVPIFPSVPSRFKEFAKTNPRECLSVVVDDKPDLCDKYSVEYYPTVLLLQKGQVHKTT